jgi:outer membrane protein
MSRIVKYIIGFVVVVIYTIGIIMYIRQEKKSSVYILSHKILADFNGTKEFKKKMLKIEQKQKAVLDSFELELKIAEKMKAKDFQYKKENFNKLYMQFAESNKEQMQEYEQKLWDQINQYVGEYGRMKGYDFIMGATGDGNIMFADSTLNKTDEVLAFINKKYAGE